MKWLLWLIWDPVRALDLVDEKGEPAYLKIGGLFAFLALYVLGWYEVLHSPAGRLDWVKWTILWAAPFGVLGLRTWFSSKVAQRREHLRKLPTEPNVWTDDERD